MGSHSAEMFRNLHALRKRAFVNDGDTGLMHVHNVYLSITKSIHRKIKWIRNSPRGFKHVIQDLIPSDPL